MELLKQIEEIFTYSQQAEINKLNSKNTELINFPQIVANFYTEKYSKTKHLSYQKSADLLKSIEMERNNCELILAFCGFLSEIYDVRDLFFYLFVRSQIETMQNIKFTALQLEKKKLAFIVGNQYISASKQYLISTTDVDSRNVILTAKMTVELYNLIVKKLGAQFSEIIGKTEEKMIVVKGIKEKCIPAITLLYIWLEEYHKFRISPNSENAIEENYETADFPREAIYEKTKEKEEKSEENKNLLDLESITLGQNKNP